MLVIDSRSNTVNYIRRRRKCDICEDIFTTVEIKRETYDELMKPVEELHKLREKLKELVGGNNVDTQN